MLAISRFDPHVKAQQKDVGLEIPHGDKPNLATGHNVQKIMMSGAQDELYRALKRYGSDIVNDMNPNFETEAQKSAKLVVLGTYLEQAALDPRLLNFADINKDGYVPSEKVREIKEILSRAHAEAHSNGGSAKLLQMSEDIKQHLTNGGKGCVIHVHYAQAIPHIRAALAKAGFHSDEIGEISGTSSGSGNNRKQHIKDFNNPKHPKRIMICTSSAREGVNLQGNAKLLAGIKDKVRRASTNIGGGDMDITLSHEWNSGAHEQAWARISRTGQNWVTKHLLYHAVQSNNKETVDQVKGRRVMAKGEAVSQAVLGKPGQEVEIPHTNFDAEDMDALFGDD